MIFGETKENTEFLLCIFSFFFQSNKKWELGSPKKSRLHTSESANDTPSLVNIKRLNSMKRRTSNSDEATTPAPGETKSSTRQQLVSQSSDDSQQQATPQLATKVSSKPPLSKRANKQPGGQKPQLQGWLYRRKQPKLSASNTSLNSLGGGGGGGNNSPSATLPASSSLTGSLGNSGGGSSSHLSSSAAALIRNHLGSKWKLFWSVLVKDYIAFYKNQDEKIPVDFLLLKDFAIVLSTNREYGFVLIERPKQLEHEFYAPGPDEFREWLRVSVVVKIDFLNTTPGAYMQDFAGLIRQLAIWTPNCPNFLVMLIWWSHMDTKWTKYERQIELACGENAKKC